MVSTPDEGLLAMRTLPSSQFLYNSKRKPFWSIQCYFRKKRKQDCDNDKSERRRPRPGRVPSEKKHWRVPGGIVLSDLLKLAGWCKDKHKNGVRSKDSPFEVRLKQRDLFRETYCSPSSGCWWCTGEAGMGVKDMTASNSANSRRNIVQIQKERTVRVLQQVLTNARWRVADDTLHATSSTSVLSFLTILYIYRRALPLVSKLWQQWSPGSRVMLSTCCGNISVSSTWSQRVCNVISRKLSRDLDVSCLGC